MKRSIKETGLFGAGVMVGEGAALVLFSMGAYGRIQFWEHLPGVFAAAIIALLILVLASCVVFGQVDEVRRYRERRERQEQLDHQTEDL